MANKYLYWNSTSNHATSFNYSRTLFDYEKDSLVTGRGLVFGITYKKTSGGNYPSVSLSNVVVGGSDVTMTELTRAEVIETISGDQIVTKYFTGTIPTINTSSMSFKLDFNSEATILDCAMFQGNATMMKFVKETDKFEHFVKYENSTWKIRTGIDAYETITTNHGDENTGVHGVGNGEVVGTLNNQSLYYKTIVSGRYNGKYLEGSTGIVTTKPNAIADVSWSPTAQEGTASWDANGYLVDAKTLKETIKMVSVASADVSVHANSPATHGISSTPNGSDLQPNAIVGKYNVQTLDNKTLSLTGNKIGDTPIIGIDSDISDNDNTHIATNRKVKLYTDNKVGVHASTTQNIHGVGITGNVVGTDKAQILTNKSIGTESGVSDGFLTFNKSWSTNSTTSTQSRFRGIDRKTPGAIPPTEADGYPQKYSELNTGYNLVPSSGSIKNILADLFAPVYFHGYNRLDANDLQNNTFTGNDIHKNMIKTTLLGSNILSKNISFANSNIYFCLLLSDGDSESKQQMTSSSNVMSIKFDKPGIYKIHFSHTGLQGTSNLSTAPKISFGVTDNGVSDYVILTPNLNLSFPDYYNQIIIKRYGYDFSTFYDYDFYYNPNDVNDPANTKYFDGTSLTNMICNSVIFYSWENSDINSDEIEITISRTPIL